MSSFRPDPVERDPVFRPMVFGAVPEASFARASEKKAESRTPAAEVVRGCSAAEHAALEAAAFEKGRASAEADAARVERACAVLEGAAAELARVSARVLHENREQMIALAGELARHWIGAELHLEPARFAGPLDRALALCVDESAATVRLHPTVLEALESSQPERIAAWSESLEVSFVADPGLGPDGFRIESGAQTIEAGLEGLVRRLREAVAEAFEADAGADAGGRDACR